MKNIFPFLNFFGNKKSNTHMSCVYVQSTLTFFFMFSRIHSIFFSCVWVLLLFFSSFPYYFLSIFNCVIVTHNKIYVFPTFLYLDLVVEMLFMYILFIAVYAFMFLLKMCIELSRARAWYKCMCKYSTSNVKCEFVDSFHQVTNVVTHIYHVQCIRFIFSSIFFSSLI